MTIRRRTIETKADTKCVSAPDHARCTSRLLPCNTWSDDVITECGSHASWHSTRRNKLAAICLEKKRLKTQEFVYSPETALGAGVGRFTSGLAGRSKLRRSFPESGRRQSDARLAKCRNCA
jgi:hypothetical protein